MSVRALGLALAFVAATGPASGPPLVQLADEVAREVHRVSGGRPVELPPIEDRTGSPALALDLHALVTARLGGRVTVAGTGPRRQVHMVLGEAPGRLLVAGRVTEEPGGALVDLVAASVDADPAGLALLEAPAGARAGTLEVRGVARSALMRAAVVDLAFLGDERLVVLEPAAVSVWRRDGLALRQESRADLAVAAPVTRFPGGALGVGTDDAAFWAITSLTGSAVLLNVEAGRLRVGGTAEALPSRATGSGLRFRPGTNLLDARLGSSTDGPFLAVEAVGGETWVVAADGRLGRVGAPAVAWSDTRVGPALTGLWKGLLAAASAEPPARTDRILVVDVRSGAPSVAGALDVEGGVRALAARVQGTGALLAAAVEDPDGGTRLVLHDLARLP
jgi:hypothetical protein